MLSALSDRPEIHHLERFLERLDVTRPDDVEFVVLFGSMARGNWSPGSDYDVLLGLRCSDGKRLIDRIGEYADLADGNIQVFPYERPEWERMFASRQALLLEAVDHGIVLSDRGGFAEMRHQFERWCASGEIARLPLGWRTGPSPG